jgi:hypothetical protein
MAILDPVDPEPKANSEPITEEIGFFERFGIQPTTAEPDATDTSINESTVRARERAQMIKERVAPETLSTENERLLGNVVQDFGADVADVDTVFKDRSLIPPIIGQYDRESKELTLAPGHRQADAGYVTKEDTTTPHNALLHELAHGLQNEAIIQSEGVSDEAEADILAQVLAERYGEPQVPLQDSVRAPGHFEKNKVATEAARSEIKEWVRQAVKDNQ